MKSEILEKKRLENVLLEQDEHGLSLNFHCNIQISKDKHGEGMKVLQAKALDVSGFPTGTS